MARRIVYFGIRLLATPFILLFSPLFYLVARTGVGVGICRKLGFHPTLIHYYQTVPRYEDLPESYYCTRQDFPGFSINPETVNITLACLSEYAGECVWPENKTVDGSYYSRNMSFGYTSAAILHSMVRSSSPKNVVEIGSGQSSLITIEALKKSHPNGDFRFTCIEPYPADWLRDAVTRNSGCVQLIEKKAEQVDMLAYLGLEENDILFIDSSHVSKLASDVNFLYMQILPRLKKGVIVHIHDIYIPYEYPRQNFHGPWKVFWNEQYLLQAFLTNNRAFEVILLGYAVQTDMTTQFKAAFPGFDLQTMRATSSFWMKKVE